MSALQELKSLGVRTERLLPTPALMDHMPTGEWGGTIPGGGHWKLVKLGTGSYTVRY